MTFNTQAEKIGLLLNVMDDPVGSVPAVRKVVEKVAQPRKFRRPVIFEGMLFRSIVDAAHFMCYAYDRDVYNWHQHLRYDRMDRDITKIKDCFVTLIRTLIKEGHSVCYAPSANMDAWPKNYKYPHANSYGEVRDLSFYTGRWI